MRIGAEVQEAPVEKAQQKFAADLPWSVVAHNDPVNLMSYVTLIFRQVFGFGREKAERHMLEVHEKGRSVVWVGGREQAEFYVQQLQAHLLLATIERLE